MRKLENTEEDKYYLHSMIEAEEIPNALISMGCFTSNRADSLKTFEYKGKVTDIDLDSGYCNWADEYGDQMPCVNINCISIKS